MLYYDVDTEIQRQLQQNGEVSLRDATILKLYFIITTLTKIKKIYFFHPKVADDFGTVPHPDPYVRGTDLRIRIRIRIRTKMSWHRNTASKRPRGVPLMRG
jgi:hypothetical protein